jgi:hypothetical protein
MIRRVRRRLLTALAVLSIASAGYWIVNNTYITTAQDRRYLKLLDREQASIRLPSTMTLIGNKTIKSTKDFEAPWSRPTQIRTYRSTLRPKDTAKEVIKALQVRRFIVKAPVCFDQPDTVSLLQETLDPVAIDISSSRRQAENQVLLGSVRVIKTSNGSDVTISFSAPSRSGPQAGYDDRVIRATPIPAWIC